MYYRCTRKNKHETVYTRHYTIVVQKIIYRETETDFEAKYTGRILPNKITKTLHEKCDENLSIALDETCKSSEVA